MSQADPTPPIEIETAPQPTASIVWLHGLGADGHDFEFIVPLLRLDDLALRFVFPNAPRRPVTINGGMVMRAWYDMRITPTGIEQNAADIAESCALLTELAEAEHARGMPFDRIVLAGFSQGGAIALHTGLRYPRALAGLLALSAPMPEIETLTRQLQPVNCRRPVFMAHGLQDNVVSYGYAEAGCRQLRAHGVAVDWHSYPMGHQVIPAEIDDISAWLRTVLA
ncbi:MAG: dienelactone hydrolase family protein [Gammaproteobacteria bacterium]|nr:dienelactone hydrolase family protein [Gammaproteobacteria bacterium]